MKKLVIGFATTSNAMAMELFAKKNMLSGKLIPVPKELSAGCGLAWQSNLDDKEELIRILEDGNISWEKMELLSTKE